MNAVRPSASRVLRLTAAAVLASALTVSSSPAPSPSATWRNPPPTDGTLTVGLLSEFSQVSDGPRYDNDLVVLRNTYEGLLQYKNNVDVPEIAPRLATAWTVDPTHTVYTFTLRDGVTFHDGTPFTSAAVEVSFDHWIATDRDTTDPLHDVATVTTPDPRTAVVTLKKPNSAFLDYLASPYGPKMESPDALRKNSARADVRTDRGTGPYTLDSGDAETGYLLKQYGAYWGPKSPFGTVYLPVYYEEPDLELAFNRGAIDAILAPLPPSRLGYYAEEAPHATSYFLPTLRPVRVTLNPSRAFLSGVRARTAFLQWLDATMLHDQGMFRRSAVATTMYPHGVIPGGADTQAITHDPQPFAQYVTTLPAGRKSFVIGYDYKDDPDSGEMSYTILEILQSLGVQVTQKGYDTRTVLGWPNDPTKGPDVFVDGRDGPGDANPYTWGHLFWDVGGEFNFFRCGSAQVDDLLSQAVATGDTARYIRASDLYSKTGCALNVAQKKEWVVAQKWLTGVAESHSIGSDGLDFSLLGIATDP